MGILDVQGGERYYEAADPLIAEFIGDLISRARSVRTCEAYARDLEHFGAFLEGRSSDKPLTFPKLKTANASDIRRYVLNLMTVKRYRVVAVRRKLSAIRTFYKFVRRERYRDDNPALDVDLPKAEQRKPKVLRETEVAKILHTRPEHANPALIVRDLAIAELLYGSGIRRAELANLNLDDVDLDLRAIVVTGKGNKRRPVPLTHTAAAAMNTYLAVRPASPDRAFFLTRHGTRMGVRQVWVVMKEFAQRSGIDRATTHSMRHSFATHLIEHGADISTVQKLLGHANISTTMVYLDQSIEHLRKSFDASHPRDDDDFGETKRR
ncbi:MAG: site-specific tyrosine recombinase XerD [Candidatus Velthaea sp.]